MWLEWVSTAPQAQHVEQRLPETGAPDLLVKLPSCGIANRVKTRVAQCSEQRLAFFTKRSDQ